MGQLEGKVAIITGGGTGLGAACARVFAREGASLMLVGRRAEKLQETAATLPKGRVEIFSGSVAEPATADQTVANTVEAFGGVDILINNAGIHAHANLVHEISVEEWREFIDIDLTGPFLFTKAAIPAMIERGGGSIFNISSMTSLVGLKYTSAYSAAKGGLNSLTRTTAVDYADKNIRVNALCAGGMEPVDRNDMNPRDMELIGQGVMEAGGAPLARIAHVDEVAEFVLTVVGPFGASMTGSIIPFDNGYTAR